jgi:hypothetical protein
VFEKELLSGVEGVFWNSGLAHIAAETFVGLGSAKKKERKSFLCL